ncbi:hypothetical protein [Roseobacter sp. HKCCA0434]|uniref:hypothetical protein n=1 Tax=Roseobacter sp. HKCCA0434 TaxID=3079297 RepID=UPI002905D9F9|nr:hypothetical protein [Roseobacter sp. HKCCA0434]
MRLPILTALATTLALGACTDTTGQAAGDSDVLSDIAIRFDEMGAGSTIVVAMNEDIVTHHLLGRQGDHYALVIHEGEGTDGPITTRTLRTADGNTVRTEFSDGTVVNYSPHNCQRVIGRCTYTEIRPDVSYRMVQINTPTETGFEVERRVILPGRVMTVRTGEARDLDRYGYWTTATTIDMDGDVTEYRALSTNYR